MGKNLLKLRNRKLLKLYDYYTDLPLNYVFLKALDLEILRLGENLNLRALLTISIYRSIKSLKLLNGSNILRSRKKESLRARVIEASKASSERAFILHTLHSPRNTYKETFSAQIIPPQNYYCGGELSLVVLFGHMAVQSHGFGNMMQSRLSIKEIELLALDYYILRTHY
ncbi:uncharacterized protein RSE6_00932 [Rhynchosporium secalis]|uniref:Uncharacterized protein n=1 Tax=Rhynchosporium secalis TaxID=38038 RepID=A0A1E1LWH5_RHYSE|nr:uncharacterized protein RSE6_00932 [Rhynchosporium secalis]